MINSSLHQMTRVLGAQHSYSKPVLHTTKSELNQAPMLETLRGSGRLFPDVAPSQAMHDEPRTLLRNRARRSITTASGEDTPPVACFSPPLRTHDHSCRIRRDHRTVGGRTTAHGRGDDAVRVDSTI
jgi:hypothetical protein